MRSKRTFEIEKNRKLIGVLEKRELSQVVNNYYPGSGSNAPTYEETLLGKPIKKDTAPIDGFPLVFNNKRDRWEVQPDFDDIQLTYDVNDNVTDVVISKNGETFKTVALTYSGDDVTQIVITHYTDRIETITLSYTGDNVTQITKTIS